MMKRAQPAESRIHHAYHKNAHVGACIDSLNYDTHGTILVIDPGDTFYLDPLRLQLPDCQVVLRQHRNDACELFFRSPVDVVLLDHSPRNPAVELLRLFKASRPSVPVVVMAEQGSESLAVEIFRSGARDYFTKPLHLSEVQQTLRAILKMRQQSEEQPADITTSGFVKALQFINANFRSQLTLSQVAEKSGMSVSSFVRLFKKKTGMTFVIYLNSVRIAESCKLLRDPGQSLLQISIHCGFNNQSHFNRVFKKFVGVSPGQYKKSINRFSLL